jgi:hypothetical protein
MKLTPGLILRAGFLFLALSIASYLTAVWSDELVASRFSMTEVTFMVAGLVVLVIAGIMGSVWPAPTTTTGDTDDF